MTKILIATVTAVFFVALVFTPAFAQSDFKKIDGEDIKNNPVFEDILKKIEKSKQQINELKENEKKRQEYKKLIDEQRKLAKESLKQELKQMEKKYDDFTPRNAFSKYVSGLDSVHQELFWDQFDYLQAKVFLAKDARDSVLKQGGSYAEAMREYVKYAKMSKIEMISIIQELNLKHNMANNDIQSYFDESGKLPRYENDLDAPCYGCTAKITKLQTSEEPIPIKRVILEKEPSQIDDLKKKLSELQLDFLNSKDVVLQKKMVFDMNQIVKQIQSLQ